MTKREAALEWIKVEVATYGEITEKALRKYIENRVSYEAFKDAARRGMAIFEANEAKLAGDAQDPNFK